MKKRIEKVRKLKDKEIIKIIEVFDDCVECWRTGDPEKCKYQSIRKKIGLKPCKSVETFNYVNKQIARGVYKVK